VILQIDMFEIIERTVQNRQEKYDLAGRLNHAHTLSYAPLSLLYGVDTRRKMAVEEVSPQSVLVP
jgi:hypothetical protein